MEWRAHDKKLANSRPLFKPYILVLKCTLRLICPFRVLKSKPASKPKNSCKERREHAEEERAHAGKSGNNTEVRISEAVQQVTEIMLQKCPHPPWSGGPTARRLCVSVLLLFAGPDCPALLKMLFISSYCVRSAFYNFQTPFSYGLAKSESHGNTSWSKLHMVVLALSRLRQKMKLNNIMR